MPPARLPRTTPDKIPLSGGVKGGSAGGWEREGRGDDCCGDGGKRLACGGGEAGDGGDGGDGGASTMGCKTTILKEGSEARSSLSIGALVVSSSSSELPSIEPLTVRRVVRASFAGTIVCIVTPRGVSPLSSAVEMLRAVLLALLLLKRYCRDSSTATLSLLEAVCSSRR